MRPVTVSVTGVGVSAPIPVDQYIAPCNIGLGVDVTGTVTYSVQHTFEDPFAEGWNPATAIWYNHPTLNALTANADGNYSAPPKAIRLNVTAGTGTARLRVVQAGAVG